MERNNIGQFIKGHKVNLGRVNLGRTFKRKKFSDETRKKMSLAKLGKKRPPLSEEWKRKLSCSAKLSQNSGRFQIGQTSKENNVNWTGGKSFEEYTYDWTDDLRESIRKRDNYICQECGISQEELNGFYKRLDIHHIDYDKFNLNSENLISLCRVCHIKTNYNRNYWINHFKGA